MKDAFVSLLRKYRRATEEDADVSVEVFIRNLKVDDCRSVKWRAGNTWAKLTPVKTRSQFGLPK